MNITPAHRAARNLASITLASSGTAASSIRLYDAQGGLLLAQQTLASPVCGDITPEGRISLLPAAGSDLVLATGEATWAEWCDGDGLAIAADAVTDEAGVGQFKLAGTTGTMVYAGGVVTLVLPALLG